MNKDIINQNHKQIWHGYQQWYTIRTNKPWFRGTWKNGKQIGYIESNWSKDINGEKTNFYII
jgi:hypothetical protein